MRIGIVTTWFERGAAYVSRQFEETLQQKHEVFIYARGGEAQAKDDPKWDKPNVHWAKKVHSPFLTTVVNRKDFLRWIKSKRIEVVLFNEQHWWMPILWCKELGLKTVCYVDYYKKETLHLFDNYDLLICNTQRHKQAFDFIADKTVYVPWGTNLQLYKPSGHKQNKEVVFFHSCGMDPYRKGTDMVIKAFQLVNCSARLIIHTQLDILQYFPDLKNTIEVLEKDGRLQLICKTVHAPGLFHLGDVYVYPTRLEGVGLTIAEALASGLACIVPDNGPMNEFVTPECGDLVKIEKQYCRPDAYYWPECEASVEHLTQIMEHMAADKQMVEEMKRKARLHAEGNLDWDKNSEKILEVFERLEKEPVKADKQDDSILKFETAGKRKVINKLLHYQLLMKMFKNVGV